MPVKIEVHGLDELEQRFSAFPGKFDALMSETIKTALIDIQSSVPPYPVQREDTTYIRTGTLGRSLGASFTGKPEGKPDVFEVHKNGARWTGSFGTRVNYAPYVIGDKTQARVHRGRWWTVTTVAMRAAPKILKRFRTAATKAARWLATK